MNNWTRIDRVLAFVRLARRPVSLVETTEALGDDFSAVSAALSSLFYSGELNRTRLANEKGQFRYHYTDPAYDELLAARRVVKAARVAVSHDCEEPTYTLTKALEEFDRGKP
jgi:predicted transcriptional regulator